MREVHTNAFSPEEQNGVAALAIELMRVRASTPVLAWSLNLKAKWLGIVFNPVFCD